MSELRRREESLAVQAATDPLTGLLNRAAFADRLEECCGLHERQLLAFVDLNGFKDVNDTFGHQLGDAVLVELAQRLRQVTREDDVLARFGGDEFVILFRTSRLEISPEVLIERIRAVIAKPWTMIAPAAVTASVGIVEDRDGTRGPDDLLREADTAMYARKHGTSVGISTETMASRSLARYRASMDGLGGSFTVLRSVDNEGLPDWQILEANALVRANYEAVCSDPVGRCQSELDIYADNSTLRDTYARALESGERRQVETILNLPASDPVWRRVVVVPVDDDAVAVMTFDISAEKIAEQALRDAENRSRSIVESAADAIIMVDDTGAILAFNRAAECVFGVSREEAIGTTYARFTPDQALPTLRNALSTGRGAERVEVTLVRGSGEPFFAQVAISSVENSENSENELFTAIVRDVTDQKKSEASLLEAQTSFRHAFEDAPIGMVLVDDVGRILRSNRSYAALLGRTQAELLRLSVAEITHPDDRETNRENLAQLFAGAIAGYDCEKRYLRADGAVVWVALRVSLVRDRDERPLFAIGQMEDITERKALKDQRDYEASHDQLTGLLNRAGITERVAVALDEARAHERKVGVLFVDLDHFTRINDTHGHNFGDEVMTTVASRLAHELRACDAIARIGGDEFAILCPGIPGMDTAVDVAQRLMTGLRDPIAVGSDETFVTATIGVAISGPDADTPEKLLRHAGLAMYRAKDQGRARVEIYDTQAHSSPIDLLRTSTALHHALERDELTVYYQPIADLCTGLVVGFEALVRWSHPERGLVAPVEFIGLAEESGLIVPIGEWVLETACRQTAQWELLRDKSTSIEPLTINVNLSPRQLDDPALATRVAQTIKRTGIAASSVCLEITENSLMRDADEAAKTLETLRAQGVRISIDDFGTGYSSLSYVKRFPVESLKIDRSFINGLGVDAEDSAIVEAIIALAHALDITAIAEGVETPLQLETLRSLRCDYAQGYLLGRPLPADVVGNRPADDLTAWHNSAVVDHARPVGRAARPD